MTTSKADRAALTAAAKAILAAPAKRKPKAPKVTINEGGMSVRDMRIYIKRKASEMKRDRINLDVRIMGRAEYEAVADAEEEGGRAEWSAVGLDGDRVLMIRAHSGWGETVQDQPEETERADACRDFRARLADFLEKDPTVVAATLDLGRDGGGTYRVVAETAHRDRHEYLLIDLTPDQDA